MDLDIEGGERWWRSILQRIRACDTFVVVLSPAGTGSVACAREREYALAGL